MGFYEAINTMVPETFDSVNWEDLHKVLQKKSKMYQLWFGKQGSGHGGMGKIPACWDKSARTTCPNCNRRNKDTDHLNKCRSKEWKKLPLQSTDGINEWMIDHTTYSELVEWVPKYLIRQGIALFDDIGNMSQIPCR